jgi:hypothetical protein
VKKLLLLTATLGAAIPMLSMSLTVDAAGPGKTRTQRGQLVHQIVMKWGNHVQLVQRADVRKWANAMGDVFGTVSVETLSRAAKAGSFDEMNNVLLGSGATRSYPHLAAAVASGALAPPGKVLGDAAEDLVFVPVTPCRIIDTRVAGGVIAANTSRAFDVTQEASPITSYAAQGGDASNCGIGNVGAFAAAVINFTVVTPSAAGYITAYPNLAAQPLAATVNYGTGDIRGNLAIVKLDQSANANELAVYTFAQTHLVADVTGYFISPEATNLNCVSTSILTSSIAANSINFFNNPLCPTGYTAVAPYCWTASSGVYSQGSGYNANAVGNATFCSWQNTTGAAQQVFGGNVCCRVPGR